MADKIKNYPENGYSDEEKTPLFQTPVILSGSRLQSAIERDKKYYMNTFGDRTPLCFTHGENMFLYGCDGKRYMDLLAGIAVNVLGHANQHLVDAITAQASSLLHCSNIYYIDNQSILAEKLVNMAPGMDRIFFACSGAEANEGAIKLARAYFNKKGKGRKNIITALNSFHGRTLATVTATGQEKYKKYYTPLPEGFLHVPFNDPQAIANAVDENTCAVMLELIQGEGGIIPAENEFIQAAAKACTDAGALLILDEIQTGMGRTGTFFAYEQYGILPDIVTVAKGLGGGIPIGALMASQRVADTFSPGDHGTTFGGNPLSCAAALAVLDEYQALDLVSKAKEMGEYFKNKLHETAEDTGEISEVRGKGLMLGIILKEEKALQVKEDLMLSGYLVNSIGNNVIRLLPPLIIEKENIDEFCRALKTVLMK